MRFPFGGVPGFTVVMISAALFGLLVPESAFPQEVREGDPVSIGSFRQLRSNVLEEDRPLLVCLPRDYEGNSTSYPVLFVLYGDQVRGYFAEAVHVVDRLSEEGSIPKMIVVGVANVDRYRDLSPVGRRENPSGIEPFSRFVVEELIPFVEGEYRTKDFRVLVGPQAGAEFGLYTLAKRPGLFDAFILENPFRSPPVHELLTAALEPIMDEGLPHHTFLQITAYDHAGFMDMTEQTEYTRRFEETVATKRPANLGLVVSYVEGTRDFIPPPNLNTGLRALFRDYRLPETREVRKLADMVAHYSDLSERFGFEVDIPERTLASQADEIGGRGDIDTAREVLEYLIERYPESVDGHWRLANLHRETGDREAALRHYHECLDLMPNMAPARYWIEKLEGEG